MILEIVTLLLALTAIIACGAVLLNEEAKRHGQGL